jgi:outer membrane protein
MLRLLALLPLPLLCAAPPAAPADADWPLIEVSTAGRALTLDEAFDRALAQSEALAQQAEAAAEAWVRVDELWSAVRRSLSLVGSQLYQDQSHGAGSRTSRPDLHAAAHQPLFTGLREFLALRVAKSQGRSAELDLARAKDLLFSDVSAAYLDLFGLHRELGIRKALVEITLDRIRELKEREKIGRTRRSEVLAAQSQLAQLFAEFEQAERRELDAQETLRFLTGLPDRLVPAEAPLAPPAPLERYLESCRTRPDVEARRGDAAAAQVSVEIARRARWPAAALDGNYYFRRVGPVEDVRWDLLFSASLPLYQGGRTAAQVAQGAARRRRAEAALAQVLRKAETEVRIAYSDVQSGLSAVTAFERAVALAEANAKSQADDYRLALVTNLDVLGALNNLQQTRLRLDQARVDLVLSRIRLDAAAGALRR